MDKYNNVKIENLTEAKFCISKSVIAGVCLAIFQALWLIGLIVAFVSDKWGVYVGSLIMISFVAVVTCIISLAMTNLQLFISYIFLILPSMLVNTFWCKAELTSNILRIYLGILALVIVLNLIRVILKTLRAIKDNSVEVVKIVARDKMLKSKMKIEGKSGINMQVVKKILYIPLLIISIVIAVSLYGGILQILLYSILGH